MSLDWPAELLADRPAPEVRSSRAFAAGLLVVVPLADGPEVVQRVIVVGDDVVHVGSRLGAPLAVGQLDRAAVAVTPEHLGADDPPVRGETVPPV